MIVINAIKKLRRLLKPQMNRIFTRTIKYIEETDDYVIEIPEEIIKELDLSVGDVLVYEHIEDRILFRKRLEY